MKSQRNTSENLTCDGQFDLITEISFNTIKNTPALHILATFV